MRLGDVDANVPQISRRNLESTDVPADTVILAVGEKCRRNGMKNGIHTDEKGGPKGQRDAREFCSWRLYRRRRSLRISVIVKAEANARTAAEAILKAPVSKELKMMRHRSLLRKEGRSCGMRR